MSNHDDYPNPIYITPSRNSTALSDPPSPEPTERTLRWKPRNNKYERIQERIHKRAKDLSNPHHPLIKEWESSIQNCPMFNGHIDGEIESNGWETDKAKLEFLIPLLTKIVFRDDLAPDKLEMSLVGKEDRLWKKHNAKSQRVNGYTYSVGGAQHCKIFELADEHPNRDGRIKLFRYIGTILHEMLHAYINIYLCVCRNCETNGAMIKGVGGHGKLWAVTAYQVEWMAANCLGLRGVNLGRHYSIAYDIIKRGMVLNMESILTSGLNEKDADLVKVKMSILRKESREARRLEE